MNKDFVEVANDSGINNGSFDVVCEQNSGINLVTNSIW